MKALGSSSAITVHKCWLRVNRDRKWARRKRPDRSRPRRNRSAFREYGGYYRFNHTEHAAVGPVSSYVYA